MLWVLPIVLSRRPDSVPRVVHMDFQYGAVTLSIMTFSGLVFVSLTPDITFTNFLRIQEF